MAGTISSLGIGSKGVLSSETLDKLREADEAGQIKPIDSKSALAEQKKSAVDNLLVLILGVKSSASALSDESAYLQRSASVLGDGVKVSVDSGVDTQNFSIETTALAKNSIFQSNEISENATALANGETFSFKVGSTNYSIEADSNLNISELSAKINATAGDSVTASVINTNSSDYRLIIRSDATGADNAITAITESSASDSTAITVGSPSDVSSISIDINGATYTANSSLTGSTDYTSLAANLQADLQASLDSDITVSEYDADGDGTIDSIKINDAQNRGIDESSLVVLDDSSSADLQAVATEAGVLNINLSKNMLEEASDATFKYNGVEVTRSSNSIDDIIFGVTIELIKEGESSSVSITQDTSTITDNVKDFVSAYNKAKAELASLTKYDEDGGTVGLFLGENTINTLNSKLSSLLLSVNSDGEVLSNYGLTLNESGTLELNETELKSKLSDDIGSLKEYFWGENEDDEKNGIFSQFNSLLDRYSNSSTGILTYMNTDLDNEVKHLAQERLKAVKLLDDRYETLRARFIAYDGMIAKMNARFASMQSMIDAQSNE